MAKGELLQIRVTPEQKRLLLEAAGNLSLSEYVIGQLFDLSPRLNESPVKISPTVTVRPVASVLPGTPVVMPDEVGLAVEVGKPVGTPWKVMGRMRSLFKRSDGTEYEGWL